MRKTSKIVKIYQLTELISEYLLKCYLFKILLEFRL